MEELAYASALVLAAVMGTAGVAKLRRRRLTERAFRSQGLAWPHTLATVVPLTEVVLAAALVVVPTWAGVAAFAVLAGFTTFLVRSIRRGDRVGCGCFGASRPAAAGPAEVARNGVLLAASALVAYGARTPVVPGPGAVATSLATAGVVAVALRRLRPSGTGGAAGPQGLPPGTEAPPLGGAGAVPGETTLVAFVAPSCAGCAELLTSLDGLPTAGFAVRVVDLDDDTASIFAAYAVRSAPYLVVVDAEGRVRSSGPARSRAEVDLLLTAR